MCWLSNDLVMNNFPQPSASHLHRTPVWIRKWDSKDPFCRNFFLQIEQIWGFRLSCINWCLLRDTIVVNVLWHTWQERCSPEKLVASLVAFSIFLWYSRWDFRDLAAKSLSHKEHWTSHLPPLQPVSLWCFWIAFDPPFNRSPQFSQMRSVFEGVSSLTTVSPALHFEPPAQLLVLIDRTLWPDFKWAAKLWYFRNLLSQPRTVQSKVASLFRIWFVFIWLCFCHFVANRFSQWSQANVLSFVWTDLIWTFRFEDERNFWKHVGHSNVFSSLWTLKCWVKFQLLFVLKKQPEKSQHNSCSFVASSLAGCLNTSVSPAWKASSIDSFLTPVARLYKSSLFALISFLFFSLASCFSCFLWWVKRWAYNLGNVPLGNGIVV